MFNRVSAETLQPRLDADYYKKEFIENDQLLKSSGAIRLASLIDTAKSSYGVLPKSEEYVASGVPLIRGGDLCFGQINPPEVHAPTSYAGGKGTAEEGDVLILIKGACIDGPDGVARVSENERGFIFNGSCYRLAFKNREVDSYFFIAYSQTRQFLMQKKRQVANTGISYNDEDSILGYLLPELGAATKKYIGDKVRQAEKFRALANNLEQRVNTLFQADFKWDYSVLKVSPFNRVRAEELENRLDLKFNSPHRLAAIRHAKSVNANLVQLDQIVEISAMIGWKGLTTEHYTTSGPWLLRGVEFSKGVIRTEDLVCVDEDKYLEQPQIHLSEGDIALTKDGTIGKAVVIPRLPNRIAAGSTVARLRKKSTSNIDPYYLEFVLAHEFVQCQIDSFATGVAQPHITQEWIALLKIPRITSEELIADTWKTHHDCLNVAKQLTTAAKHLVEALIEGQLSEADLIAAEQALQTGNDQSDRQILNRLKTDGIDGHGQALFSDLDQLYRLLEQANEPVG